jgi:hypothetical protein
MKRIAAHSKGRLSTFLFSLLSAAAFFTDALVCIYVMATDQHTVITDLLIWDLKGKSYLTGLLGNLLITGILSFLLALLSDLIRYVRVTLKEQPSAQSPAAMRVLNLASPWVEEQDNITGDLLEEYSQFESPTRAYFWLLKQVLTSAFPLILKRMKSRFSSGSGKQTF